MIGTAISEGVKFPGVSEAIGGAVAGWTNNFEALENIVFLHDQASLTATGTFKPLTVTIEGLLTGTVDGKNEMFGNKTLPRNAVTISSEDGGTGPTLLIPMFAEFTVLDYINQACTWEGK